MICRCPLLVVYVYYVHVFVVCVDCVRALFSDCVLWVSTGQQAHDARGVPLYIARCQRISVLFGSL